MERLKSMSMACDNFLLFAAIKSNKCHVRNRQNMLSRALRIILKRKRRVKYPRIAEYFTTN